MKTRIIAYYSIFIGFAVIGMWVLILARDPLSEGKIELTFHLVSEFIMALFCLISGFLLLKGHSLGVKLNIIGLSMILYSVLNAAGYYGERNEAPMIVLFTFLFLFSAIALFMQIVPDKKKI